jgi:hypothetical protein
VRFKLVIAIVVTVPTLTACNTQKSRVEVTPQLCWHSGNPVGFSDARGNPGRWVTNSYAPFVISQGKQFAMDFSPTNSFVSRNNDKEQPELLYLDSIALRMSVVVSNSTIQLSGRAKYHLHWGETFSDYSANQQTLRAYSTRYEGTAIRFDGRCHFGDEMEIGIGNSFDDPVFKLKFRPTTAVESPFQPVKGSSRRQLIRLSYFPPAVPLQTNRPVHTGQALKESE